MKFSTTLFASLFSLGMALSVSAMDKQHQTITINADDSGDAVVSIDKQGQVNIYKVSKEALTNPELLAEELADVPPETAEHLKKALSKLANIKHFERSIEVTDANNTANVEVFIEELSDFKVLSPDDKSLHTVKEVKVIKVNDGNVEVVDGEHVMSDEEHHAIKKVIRNIEIEDKEGGFVVIESVDNKDIQVMVKHLGDPKGGVPYSVLKDMFKNTDLTTDQLNELQQLLDSKR
ncbi:MAG: hypothetical protein ACPGTQ_03800 [Colwellia sp.]